MTRRTLTTRVLVVVGLAVAVGLASAASPFASSSPDGLERIATDKGFEGSAEVHAVQQQAPIPDYVFPGVDNARLATGLAGFVGTLVVFATSWALAVLIRRRRLARSTGLAAAG